MSPVVTIGEAARRVGVQEHVLRRAESRGVIGPVPRVGGARAFPVVELPQIAAALSRAGYPVRPGDSAHA